MLDEQFPKQQLITGIPEFPTSREPVHTPIYEDGNLQMHSTQTQEATDYSPEWGYTVLAKNRYGEKYNGRSLIGRDTQIDGGVYYGTYDGEAIVVDSEKYPTQFNKIYETAKQKATGLNGEVDRSSVLRSVFDTVSETMRYSQQDVDGLLQELALTNGDEKLVNGTKVSLGDFIEEGVGVCRHQALATGFLLEKMKKDGHIRGEVSVDRSQRWSPNGEPEGHAWVRYTSHSGEIMILDVAQGYFGLLHDSEGQKRGWDYLRPEEQLVRTARHAGHTAVPPFANAKINSGHEKPKLVHVSSGEMLAAKKELERYVEFTDAPSAESVQAGIDRAKNLLDSGNAVQMLQAELFINEKEAQQMSKGLKRTTIYELAEPLYIDPKQIKGVAGHDSWMGRGTEGNESMRDRKTNAVMTSWELIRDYATRETQLPSIGGDGEVIVYMTKKGPVLFATNAHRTSAAKLRAEPLGVSSFSIFE